MDRLGDRGGGVWVVWEVTPLVMEDLCLTEKTGGLHFGWCFPFALSAKTGDFWLTYDR